MAVLTKNWAQVSAVPAVRVEGAGNKAASLSLRLSSVYPSRRDEQMKCTCDMLGTQVGVPQVSAVSRYLMCRLSAGS